MDPKWFLLAISRFHINRELLTGHSHRVSIQLSISWITRELLEYHFNLKNDKFQFYNQITEFRFIFFGKFWATFRLKNRNFTEE